MTTDQLAARLEHLERSHARLKRLATGFGLLLAGAFAGAMNGEEIPDVIRAHRFEVPNVEGSHRPAVVIGGPVDSVARIREGLMKHNGLDEQAADRKIDLMGMRGNGGSIEIAGPDGLLVAIIDSAGHFASQSMSSFELEIIHPGADLQLQLWRAARAPGPSAKPAGVHVSTTDEGGCLSLLNKTGEVVCTLRADEYGNGEIGAWNRKGTGRTLGPGP